MYSEHTTNNPPNKIASHQQSTQDNITPTIYPRRYHHTNNLPKITSHQQSTQDNIIPTIHPTQDNITPTIYPTRYHHTNNPPNTRYCHANKHTILQINKRIRCHQMNSTRSKNVIRNRKPHIPLLSPILSPTILHNVIRDLSILRIAHQQNAMI